MKRTGGRNASPTTFRHWGVPTLKLEIPVMKKFAQAAAVTIALLGLAACSTGAHLNLGDHQNGFGVGAHGSVGKGGVDAGGGVGVHVGGHGFDFGTGAGVH
ncbi:MAG TPA: hypothetical protein V6D22_01220 [Candidatus Obscuribacterales bacterium]